MGPRAEGQDPSGRAGLPGPAGLRAEGSQAQGCLAWHEPDSETLRCVLAAQDPVADKSTSRSRGTPEARRAQHDSERLPCRGRASPPVLLLRSGHRQHPSEAPARLMSPDRAQNDRWAMILTCILSSDDARSLGGGGSVSLREAPQSAFSFLCFQTVKGGIGPGTGSQRR